MTGLAFPKPERRGPKPRKPIPRSAIRRMSDEVAALAETINRGLKRSAKPIPRVTQTPRGKEEAALNAMWSRAVKARDPFCRFMFRCAGTDASVDAAHLYGKGSHPRLRWFLLNGVGACRRCHDYFDRVLTPDQRQTWAMRNLGEAAVIALTAVHIVGTSPDRAEVRATLTAALKQYRRAA